jgi:hypothetical protein
MIGKRSIIDIVFNKLDLIEAAADREAAHEFLRVVEHDLNGRFASVFGGLTFSRTAARPEGGPLPPAYGVESLFNGWLDTSKLVEREFRTPDARDHLGNEFDRFEHRGR